ncbi:hypothetical protein HNQ96_006470, partial [Aminobacter lissarensis]|nr:hypothetical protein [Aminobacter lissarensis]
MREGTEPCRGLSCLNTATRIPTVSFPHSLYTKLNTQD